MLLKSIEAHRPIVALIAFWEFPYEKCVEFEVIQKPFLKSPEWKATSFRLETSFPFSSSILKRRLTFSCRSIMLSKVDPINAFQIGTIRLSVNSIQLK
jgi:hypothetical protein